VEEPREDLASVQPQDTLSSRQEAQVTPETRALALLAAVRVEQAGLSRSAALAWERAVFREAFLESGPGLRIRAFLEGRRRGE
jgi:hypothetical protein